MNLLLVTVNYNPREIKLILTWFHFCVNTVSLSVDVKCYFLMFFQAHVSVCYIFPYKIKIALLLNMSCILH